MEQGLTAKSAVHFYDFSIRQAGFHLETAFVLVGDSVGATDRIVVCRAGWTLAGDLTSAFLHASGFGWTAVFSAG